jgi:hypothetical protein
MRKYEPLKNFLRTVRVSHYRVGFDEIEKLLKSNLPKTAFKRPEWWSNNDDGHSQARAWLSVGWRTEQIDLTGRKLTFRKVTGKGQSSPPDRSDPWGCMAGTVTILPGTDLTAPTGEVWNAEGGAAAQ